MPGQNDLSLTSIHPSIHLSIHLDSRGAGLYPSSRWVRGLESTDGLWHCKFVKRPLRRAATLTSSCLWYTEQRGAQQATKGVFRTLSQFCFSVSIIFHASDQFLHFEPCLSPPLLCLFDEADVVNSPIVRVFIFFLTCVYRQFSIFDISGSLLFSLFASRTWDIVLFIYFSFSILLFIQNYTPLLMQLIVNEKKIASLRMFLLMSTARVCVINVMNAYGVH